MWLILLEAGLALLIAAAFIWWVIPKNPRGK